MCVEVLPSCCEGLLSDIMSSASRLCGTIYKCEVRLRCYYVLFPCQNISGVFPLYLSCTQQNKNLSPPTNRNRHPQCHRPSSFLDAYPKQLLLGRGVKVLSSKRRRSRTAVRECSQDDIRVAICKTPTTPIQPSASTGDRNRRGQSVFQTD